MFTNKTDNTKKNYSVLVKALVHTNTYNDVKDKLKDLLEKIYPEVNDIS